MLSVWPRHHKRGRAEQIAHGSSMSAPLLFAPESASVNDGAFGFAPRKKDRSALISAISNLSIQYNMQAVAVALLLMDSGSNAAGYVPPYPRSTLQTSLLNSLVFAGAIAGQLVMGACGDFCGRRNAMAFTNFLAFIGALGSAVFTWGEALYTILMVCRFVLGIGVGGKYPLSATIRSEACGEAQRSGTGEPQSTTHRHHSETQVALGFFWQTPGAMLPYAVALAVMQWFGPADHSRETGKEAAAQIIDAPHISWA